jgi:hypothetical protein
MRDVFVVESVATLPDADSVLRAQGIPRGAQLSPRVRDLLEDSLARYHRLADVQGLVERVSRDEFELVYHGEGRNADATPIQQVFPRADHLALFVATLGAEVSQHISDMFAANDLALAAMLDAVASEAAERAVDLIGRRFLERLDRAGALVPGTVQLAYSPGYCGWHISGQGRLFARLRPEEIDVSINSSFLMSPVKSVSGVLVVGAPEIHQFDDDFEFCRACATRHCRNRLAALQGT